MAANEQNYGALLSKFLGSPQAMGLAQGLLSAPYDQYGRRAPFGQALGAGLLGMQQAEQAEQQRRMQEQKMGLAERGMALEEQKFGVAQAAAQATQEQKQKQLEYFQKLISGEPGAVADAQALDDETARRAQIALNAGDLGAAQKILLEKPEKVDGATTSKLLSAENIEKTLEAINPDDLTQYSGLLGTFQRGYGAVTPLPGTENYERYQTAKAQSELLADQVRQFYGASISPKMMDKIEKLVNPTAYNLSPEAAKKNFLEIKRLLEAEGETYRQAARKDKKKPEKKPKEAAADPLNLLGE